MGRSCVRTHPIRQNSTVQPRRALGGKEDSPGWRDAACRGGAEGSVEWTWRALSAARVPRRAQGSELTAAAMTWRSPREGACPVV